MEIISRSEARKRGLTQYFTGDPCRNGHRSYRYTQSGSCSSCIRSYNQPAESLQNSHEMNQKRRDNLARLVSFRTRVADCDVGFISEMILASVKAREPGARMADVFKTSPGVKRVEFSGVHQFNCFAEDLTGLRDATVKIFDSRCVQVKDIPTFVPPPIDWPEGDPR